jgi:hypothetical protein
MSHTIDELWNERTFENNPITASGLPRYFVDSTLPPHARPAYDWGDRMKYAFYSYKRYAASTHPWWKPKLNGKFDKFRWDLHLKLLKWGVIV